MDTRDPEAFRELYATHYGAVRRYVAPRAASDDVDDVVSETFLVAWRRAANVPDHTLPWLLNVASKVLANQRRTAGRAVALAERIGEVAVLHAAGVESDVERHAQQRALLSALQTLAPADRELVLLHVWDDLRPREIAVVLGLGAVATRARLSRARRRLRQALLVELAADHSPSPIASTPTGARTPSPTPTTKRTA